MFPQKNNFQIIYYTKKCVFLPFSLRTIGWETDLF